VVHSFVSVFSTKMLNFSTEMVMVDVKDVILGSCEYSVRFMRLVSFLLHCNASNLLFEILKHDKIWGKFE